MEEEKSPMTGMTQEEKETVSIHMQNTFASRYQKREA